MNEHPPYRYLPGERCGPDGGRQCWPERNRRVGGPGPQGTPPRVVTPVPPPSGSPPATVDPLTLQPPPVHPAAGKMNKCNYSMHKFDYSNNTKFKEHKL